MNFLAQLWREVSLHLELSESARRIAPMLAEQLPVDRLIVRKLERDPVRLTTVASASAQPEETSDSFATRTDCEPGLTKELVTQLSSDSALVLHANRTLWSSLVPQGLHGNVIALPLAAAGRPLGVALLIADSSKGLSEQHLAAAQQLVEPLRVAFENDRRLNELARMREALERSEERRVGKECELKCRSRWSPYH